MNTSSHRYNDRQTDGRGLQIRRSFFFVKNAQPNVLRVCNFSTRIFLEEYILKITDLWNIMSYILVGY